MAITAPTKLTNFSGFIEPEKSTAIFERAARQSVVQRLATKRPLGASGVSVPVVTGRPSAGWTSEGEKKHASSGSMTLKTMTPKKLTCIMVDSMEVVRANPGGYVTNARDQIAEAFAVAFDRAALHDEGPDGTAGAGPFSTFIGQTSKTQEVGSTAQASGGIHGDLVAAMAKIVVDSDATGRRYRLSGWALDDILEPALWGAVDTTGHPIYTELPLNAESDVLNTAGRLLRRPSFLGEGVSSINQTDAVGFGGDWSQTAWGVVGGINYSIRDDVTVTINGDLVSCWENNLVAFRAEAEYGFLVNDADAFVKLTNTNNTPVTSA